MINVPVRGGPFRQRNGNLATGSVQFRPRAYGIGTVDHALYPRLTVTMVLGEGGLISGQLQAVDDPDVSPTGGWTYQVTELIDGASPRTYDIEVFASEAGGGFDLADKAPVDPAAGVTPGATVFGTALVSAPTPAAGRDVLELGTAASSDVEDFDPAGAATAAQAAAAADATAKANAAQAASQPANANLTAFSGLAATADRLPYFTGSGMNITGFTNAARQLLDDASSTAMRATLGLGTAAVAAASSFAPRPSTQLITATGAGTWDINPLIASGYTRARLEGVGGGGSGGAGRRGAAGTVRTGGGGGSGAPLAIADVSLAELLAQYPTGLIPYSVAVGCAGAPAQTVNDSNGAAGDAGTFAANSTTVGEFFVARRGTPGGGGSTTSAAGGGTNNAGTGAGGAGGSSSSIGSIGVGGASAGGGGGGGSGGGITVGDLLSGGATGGQAGVAFGLVSSAGSGGAGGVAGGGAAPTQGTPVQFPGNPGPGAGGGASASVIVGQAGANALPTSGAGGGGGGASLNGFNSGAGGNGGSGYLRITAY